MKSIEASHFPHPLFRSNIFNLSTLRLSRCLLNHLIRSISASLVSRTRILSIPFATNRLIYPQQPATATTVLSHCLPSQTSYLIPLKHRAKHECTVPLTVHSGLNTILQYTSVISLHISPTALQTWRDDLSPIYAGVF